MTMSDKELNEWNKKIRALEEHISKEFPTGCSGLNGDDCDKCWLSGAELCTSWHYLCDLMGELARKDV